MENGKQLVESGAWNSVLDYTLMGWSHVRTTPVWDNVQHNTIRRQCFKSLAGHCLQAVRQLHSKWDSDHRRHIKHKLERLRADSDDIDSSLAYLSNLNGSTPVELDE